jgi:biotin transporter BioY
MNYSNILQSEKAIPSRAVNIVLILLASWIIGVSAQLSFTLPFSPVPITGQTIIVLLIGALLGKKRGAAAVGLYLAQGAAGLPVFAGGRSGLAVLVGPTGGYLVGFLVAAYVVGCLTELRYERSIIYTGITLLIGNGIIYAFGLIWLVRFVGESQVLGLGFYPFLVGDIIKIILGLVGIRGSRLILGLANHKG